jgi:hypothetical protein
MRRTMHRHITLMLLIWAAPCSGQMTGNPSHTGAAFLELGGNGGSGATANLELSVFRTVAVRAGIGRCVSAQTTIAPFQLVWAIGRGSSRLEVAAGAVLAHEPRNFSGTFHWDGTKMFPTGFLGYREQDSGGRFLRAGVVPLLWLDHHQLFPALSFGMVL